MRAGDLRHRLIIQSPLPTANADAGLADNWTTIATVWAAVEPLTGRELFSAQRTVAETSHRITIRYRKGLRSDMRILYDNREYRIVSIIDQGNRHQWLELMCVVYD